jgi:hypothetical protein
MQRRPLCDWSILLSWWLPQVTDAVEKRICRNLGATLIQVREQTRNLDSKVHVLGFVRFQILISHFFCGDFFDSIDPLQPSAVLVISKAGPPLFKWPNVPSALSVAYLK